MAGTFYWLGRSLRSSLNDDEPNLLVYAGVQFTF
jgi:hypothetical protein